MIVTFKCGCFYNKTVTSAVAFSLTHDVSLEDLQDAQEVLRRRQTGLVGDVQSGGDVRGETVQVFPQESLGGVLTLRFFGVDFSDEQSLKSRQEFQTRRERVPLQRHLPRRTQLLQAELRLGAAVPAKRHEARGEARITREGAGRMSK